MANRRKNVLENKQTDAVTNSMKASAWREIQEEFNSTCGGEGHFRDAKCLRSKYECIKKELRKQSNVNDWKETGGGPYQPPPCLPNTEEERELLQAIQLSVEGLPPIGDGDDGFQTGRFLQEVSNVEVVNVEVDWEKSSAIMLRTPRPSPLCVGSGEHSQDNTENLVPHQRCTPPPPSQPQRQQQESEPATVSVKNKSEGVNRRRPVLFKKRCMSSSSAKFEELAEKKTKLVLIKEEIKKQELLNQKERHNQVMKNLRLEEEVQKLLAEEAKIRIEI